MVLSGILASADLVGGIVAGVVVLAIVMMIAFRSFLTVVTEYQRAVFFRFGRIRAQAKGPGLIFRIPAVDRVVKVESISEFNSFCTAHAGSIFLLR